MSEAATLAEVIFEYSREDLAHEVSLRPEAWRLLSQIDGIRSLGQIARQLGVDAEAAGKTAEALYAAGILQVAPGSPSLPRPTIGSAFFDQLIRELTLVMGPYASAIVEDEISALAETRDRFPRERLGELIERVSQSITVPTDRLKFKQTVWELVPRY